MEMSAKPSFLPDSSVDSGYSGLILADSGLIWVCFGSALGLIWVCFAGARWARGTDHVQEKVANCNRNTYFLRIFYRKCRDNGELPLENDDCVLKNGRLLLQLEVRAAGYRHGFWFFEPAY